jgi:D-lactate dehydrogenase
MAGAVGDIGATLKLALFDCHAYDRVAFETANSVHGHTLVFFEPRLLPETAPLAVGADVVIPFVNDRVDANVITLLKMYGVRLIAVRAAGVNAIDLAAATAVGLPVVRVPAYSPNAVAEHTFALLLSLVRKTHRAWARVREGNFSLDGLVGFDLAGKTLGIVGTGRIGRVAVGIARGFGCRVLVYDISPDPAWAATVGAEYVALDTLLAASDIVSLHLPLTPQSRHLINAAALARLPRHAILINTSRGALIDTSALIACLKAGTIGAAGLDVYELEEGIFFENLADQPLQDDMLARLIGFPNVLVTSHQGFLTREALSNIAETTLENCRRLAAGESLLHRVTLSPSVG